MLRFDFFQAKGENRIKAKQWHSIEGVQLLDDCNSFILTYIFLQADAGQHAAQIIETMGWCNFVQMGSRRMIHVIWGHPNLSNAIFAWDNTTKIHLGTEHRRGRFFPQIWRMWRQLLHPKVLINVSI